MSKQSESRRDGTDVGPGKIAWSDVSMPLEMKSASDSRTEYEMPWKKLGKLGSAVFTSIMAGLLYIISSVAIDMVFSKEIELKHKVPPSFFITIGFAFYLGMRQWNRTEGRK